ncbi:small kinetochore-associated protein isoform X1 [Columba livia]|uniref:small kinetochore-associated protein isoform X1 n=1 Tax=Columba livia TaxID=8932 RepID=UPI0031BA72CD
MDGEPSRIPVYSGPHRSGPPAGAYGRPCSALPWGCGGSGVCKRDPVPPWPVLPVAKPDYGLYSSVLSAFKASVDPFFGKGASLGRAGVAGRHGRVRCAEQRPGGADPPLRSASQPPTASQTCGRAGSALKTRAVLYRWEFLCCSSINVPMEVQPAFSSKKQCVSKTADVEFSKDPNFNFSSNAPADGVFKATNQGLPKSAKKVEPPSKKMATRGGTLNRYKLEAELKSKNQLLETAKQQLHSRLTGAQGIIKDLKEENEGLVQEVEKLKKFQETCMVILESRNIDPVTGNNILEEEEKTQECQKQTTLLTGKLIEELRLFNQTAAKEKEALQAAMAKWKSAEEERQQSLEKHSSFQAEIKECSTVLDELEQLLVM